MSYIVCATRVIMPRPQLTHLSGGVAADTLVKRLRGGNQRGARRLTARAPANADEVEESSVGKQYVVATV
jgi:hypothetical protein